MNEIEKPKVLESYKILDPRNDYSDMTNYILRYCACPVIGERYIDGVCGYPTSGKRPVRKFIFSATMTQDIGKLSSLGMLSPEIISVGSSLPGETRSDDAVFTLPSTLHEYVVSTAMANKPLILLQLLNQFHLTDKTLIFAHSTETATRLHHLLTRAYAVLSPSNKVALISSEVPSTQRKKLLSQFTSGILNMYASCKCR
jgi:ATP-dependent RNA helicase DDX51/DBP6